ncbi:MAG: amidase family protein [Pseudomonadota bacterium]
MDWQNLTAAEQGRAIGAGDLDPVDITEGYLDAAAAHPHADRIYARMTADRARAEAVAAHDRAKAGMRLGPLDGVPISWKDLFDSAGVGTEAGSALLKGRVPGRDAEVLAAATAGGLICLGKTHMSELAFSGLGLNPVTATPPNVNDPALISGGSSSGAAASVAFGLASAGIGSDTGGSVRIPAAWNDLVGLKTTSGRVSLAGVVPLCLRFDTVGPLARSVEDAALLLAALEGARAPDLTGSDLSGARLLVLDTVAFDAIEDAPAQAFDAAVARLETAGAQITRRAVPAVAEAMTLTGTLYAPEAYGLWKDVIEAAPHKMYAEILERFRGGAAVSAPDYVAGWARLEALRGAYHEAVAGFDAVILPASPILPPNIARLESDHAYYVERNLLALRNTRIGNLMGSAALTLPTGVPSCGFMLMAPPMGEARLLRLGAAVERVLRENPA